MADKCADASISRMFSSDSFSIASLLSSAHPPIRRAQLPVSMHDDPLSRLRKLSTLPDSASSAGDHFILSVDSEITSGVQEQPEATSGCKIADTSTSSDSGAVSTSSDVANPSDAIDSADSGQFYKSIILQSNPSAIHPNRIPMSLSKKTHPHADWRGSHPHWSRKILPGGEGNPKSQRKKKAKRRQGSTKRRQSTPIDAHRRQSTPIKSPSQTS